MDEKGQAQGRGTNLACVTHTAGQEADGNLIYVFYLQHHSFQLLPQVEEERLIPFS